MITPLTWSDVVEESNWYQGSRVGSLERKHKPTAYDLNDVAEERNEPARACCCLIHQRKGHTSEPGQARDLNPPSNEQV